MQVNIDGDARRFCQQCSSFHVLAAFDGSRRFGTVQIYTCECHARDKVLRFRL